jgi:type II restriction enzyme
MGKIEEARIILQDLGMPKSQQNDISALTLLALCSIKYNSSWSDAYRSSQTVTKGIMNFIKKEYQKDYAPNTRETFRRQVLHQFVQGEIADYNPDDPNLPTNSPNAHYAITNQALEVVKNYKYRQLSKNN